MSYNTTLQSNNTNLRAILDTINTLPEVGGGEQVTPVISVGSNGLITATAGTKSSTYQLAFQAAKTITPSSTSQIAVSSGYYTGGNVTVKGDSNLVAGNIKSGVSIFGVSGTLEEGGGNVEDMIIGRAIRGVYTNSKATVVGEYAFYGCDKLTSVNFPSVTTISSNAFCECTELASVSFPVATTIGEYAFMSCWSKLTSVNFPLVTTISGWAFSGCFKLVSVSFPAATSIYNLAFWRCDDLSTVILAGSSVCKLVHSNAFSSTPYAGYPSNFSGTPHIYVPSSLVTAYQSATNWARYSSYFSAIEDMT